MDTIDLDVSPLLVPNKRFAVQVHTEEDAIAFISFMMQNYPEKTVNWRLDNHHFGHYSTTCYAPWLNRADSSMKYCSADYYLDYGYDVVQFEELICYEIDDSDKPLEFLFGGPCGG